MRATVSTISPLTRVPMQIGTALMPAKRRNTSDLPSITGSAAYGPTSPMPDTAVPSVTIATVFWRIV
ncbi:hypothetical protein Y603_3503 [Burkholderia pseudomallei MSHR1153]|nr:hypothetical protein Y603_3503 [Burkholderia pseudomallei MSHR1153]